MRLTNTCTAYSIKLWLWLHCKNTILTHLPRYKKKSYLIAFLSFLIISKSSVLFYLLFSSILDRSRLHHLGLLQCFTVKLHSIMLILHPQSFFSFFRPNDLQTNDVHILLSQSVTHYTVFDHHIVRLLLYVVFVPILPD